MLQTETSVTEHKHVHICQFRTHSSIERLKLCYALLNLQLQMVLGHKQQVCCPSSSGYCLKLQILQTFARTHQGPQYCPEMFAPPMPAPHNIVKQGAYHASRLLWARGTQRHTTLLCIADMRNRDVQHVQHVCQTHQAQQDSPMTPSGSSGDCKCSFKLEALHLQITYRSFYRSTDASCRAWHILILQDQSLQCLTPKPYNYSLQALAQVLHPYMHQVWRSPAKLSVCFGSG